MVNEKHDRLSVFYLRTRMEKIALGTVQFGLDYGISNSQGKTSFEETVKILELASSSGINTLDTAFSYGTSEVVLGNIIQKYPDFEIVSKFPKPEEGSRISDYLSQSLQKLKINYLYAYLAHDADVLINDPQLWDEVVELKSKGVISKIGYSLYSPEQLEKLLDLNFVPDIVQLPYNVLDRRFEQFFGEFKKHETIIHTRSAFLQGLLFMDSEHLSSYFDPIKPFLKEIQSTFFSRSDLSSALMRFCIDNSFIDKVVIGVNTEQQLSENLSGLRSFKSVSKWPNFEVKDKSMLLPYNWPKNL